MNKFHIRLLRDMKFLTQTLESSFSSYYTKSLSVSCQPVRQSYDVFISNIGNAIWACVFIMDENHREKKV